jgi:hypothetical protein
MDTSGFFHNAGTTPAGGRRPAPAAAIGVGFCGCL